MAVICRFFSAAEKKAGKGLITLKRLAYKYAKASTDGLAVFDRRSHSCRLGKVAVFGIMEAAIICSANL